MLVDRGRMGLSIKVKPANLRGVTGHQQICHKLDLEYPSQVHPTRIHRLGRLLAEKENTQRLVSLGLTGYQFEISISLIMDVQTFPGIQILINTFLAQIPQVAHQTVAVLNHLFHRKDLLCFRMFFAKCVMAF